MRATFHPATVRAAAQDAITHWEGVFERRREDWIATESAKMIGFFKRRPMGREQAEANFGASFFEGGAENGNFWWESDAIAIAHRLAGDTAREGALTVTLSSAEIAVLTPVLPMVDESE